MKKIIEFVKEKSHILMLIGMVLLVGSLLFVFQTKNSDSPKQVTYIVTIVAVIIYIIGRIGAAIKRSEDKKRYYSHSDDENISEKENIEV